MKYVVANKTIQGVHDTYELLEYSINKVNKFISGKIIKLLVDSNGYINSIIEPFNISNQVDIIIDPSWNEESLPVPKPEGFDPLDPLTWGYLSWDDIPKVQNPDTLYADKIINAEDKEKEIFEYLASINFIPSNGVIAS